MYDLCCVEFLSLCFILGFVEGRVFFDLSWFLVSGIVCWGTEGKGWREIGICLVYWLYRDMGVVCILGWEEERLLKIMLGIFNIKFWL